MRSSILIALFTVLLLSITTTAGATSEIGLRYLGGATGEPGTGVCAGDMECVPAQENDIVKFALVILVDSLGMTSWSFDFRWDTNLEPGDDENNPTGSFDDELDLVNFNIRGALSFHIVAPGTPPTTVDLGYTLGEGPEPGSQEVQESTTDQEGHLWQWTAIPNAVLLPFPTNTSFRVGRVSLKVNSALGRDDPENHFARPGGSTFGTSPIANGSPFEQITPNFGSFTIMSAPEPGTSLLIASSLSVLALLALRSKRDN